jgi:ribonuclease P protein component
MEFCSDEADLSAFQDTTETDPRFSRTYEHPWWTSGNQCPAGEGTSASRRVKPERAKLPRKARLQGGAQFTGEFPVKRFGRYFLVLARKNPAGGAGRLGLVVGKKAVSLAVVRSRMKRAIREVFRTQRGKVGQVDVVVRARRSAPGQELPLAREELARLLSQVS